MISLAAVRSSNGLDMCSDGVGKDRGLGMASL